MAAALCNACRAPIRWARTVAGRSIALDPAPNAAGNCYFDAAGRVCVLGPEGAQRRLFDKPEAPERRYMPHAATCARARPAATAATEPGEGRRAPAPEDLRHLAPHLWARFEQPKT